VIMLMTPEGKKVQVSLKNDLCLYRAPENPPDTGIAYTVGTNLYYHKARSGRKYYYKYFWSMWQGDEDRYELVPEDEAKRFVLERLGQQGHIADGVCDYNCCEVWGDDFFEEDA